jgi:hypothetical protein
MSDPNPSRKLGPKAFLRARIPRTMDPEKGHVKLWALRAASGPDLTLAMDSGSIYLAAGVGDDLLN